VNKMKMSLNVCHVCKGTGMDNIMGKPIICKLCKGTGNLPNISVQRVTGEFTGTVAEKILNNNKHR